MFVTISEYKRLNNENIKSAVFFAKSEKMDINTSKNDSQFMNPVENPVIRYTGTIDHFRIYWSIR